MIIVDTNVISEAMKPLPNAQVIEWLNNQETMHLFLTTITIGEIAYGLQVLPESKRRRALQQTFDQLVGNAFTNRILPFDEQSARLYGEIMANRRKIGRPLAIADGQIISIAQNQGFAIATRNAQDFADCNVRVINPFPAKESG